ncbi:MAG: hypothetical protein AUI14_17065 [Actinobacteria bacterium 13_2_20CM_2_71_6]|nr:MAG: hypothetical protein AUI14_17065 [Actinobacteria bacterium 13_2_20CM_2_71_6]
MVTREDRRAVALATRRSARQVVRRAVAPEVEPERVEAQPGEDQTVELQPVELQPVELQAVELQPVEVRPVEPKPVARRPRPIRKPRLKNRPARRGRLAVQLLVVALVGAVAAAGLLGRQWYDQRQLDTARQQALAAARQVTVDFVSISAATIDRDLQRIADGATGQFKEEFARGMAQVRAAVVENKVDSRGTVLRAGVVSADRRTAVVLVAVDATVKNANAPDGRLSHYRIQVNLGRDGASGRWLVSQLQFVG